MSAPTPCLSEHMALRPEPAGDVPGHELLVEGDPRFGEVLAASLELLEHVVLPAALARHGGHAPQGLDPTVAAMSQRCRHLDQVVVHLTPRRLPADDVLARELACLRAAQQLQRAATLALHHGTAGRMLAESLQACADATLCCGAELDNRTGVLLRLVANGVPAPEAARAAAAAVA